jgi:hypothetical protein
MTDQIGKIIRSENHVIYWAQVDNNTEVKPAPTPKDCAFGSFVKIIPLEPSNLVLVGLIFDTILIDRDALRAGPRLAVDIDSQNSLFPDFIDERIKLVKILSIGFFDSQKSPHHNFPDVAPNLNDKVVKMTDDEIREFHLIKGDYQIGYYSAALGAPEILVRPLILRILPKLMDLFPPEKKPILKLLENNLEFKMKMQGGFA